MSHQITTIKIWCEKDKNLGHIFSKFQVCGRIIGLQERQALKNGKVIEITFEKPVNRIKAKELIANEKHLFPKSIIPEHPGNSSVSLKIVRPRIMERLEKLDLQRLYCRLPWDKNERQVEKDFLRHFAQFGQLEYHECIRNDQGRISNGYVRYFQQKDAERALKQCDLIYEAKFAYAKKIKPGFTQLRRHKLCGKYIPSNVYSYHKHICAVQQQLSK